MKKLNPNLITNAALIVGTLDILAACLNFYFKTGKNVSIVLKYIASAVFGNDAMMGSEEMIFVGLFLHYLIALVFTIIFAFIYPKLWAWFQNNLIIAITYGIFVWTVMNLLIVPNSLAAKVPFSWSGAITGALILIICMGYPLAYLFHKNKAYLTKN
jgi:hypothetical protein